MSGKNLPGGLIHIKDNADGTCSYVFDKFCIFEKGFMNGLYYALSPLIKQGTTVPIFNYGNNSGVLFDFIDNNGNSITVDQATVSGNFALSFPAITSNDTLVTTSLAQTLYSKTLSAPIFNGISPEFKTKDIFTGSPTAMQFGSGSNIVNINPVIGSAGVINLTLPGNGTALITDTSTATLTNKTLTSPVFSGTSSGIIQNSSQYCFKAYVSVGVNNVTGDGTDYKVIFDSIDFQVGTGYDTSTGVFTAPVSGLYHFTANVQMNGFTTTNTNVFSYFMHNTQRYNMHMTSNISISIGYLVENFSTTFKLAANDTVSCGIQVEGESSGTLNIGTIGDEYNTNWIGTLLVPLG